MALDEHDMEPVECPTCKGFSVRGFIARFGKCGRCVKADRMWSHTGGVNP